MESGADTIEILDWMKEQGGVFEIAAADKLFYIPGWPIYPETVSEYKKFLSEFQFVYDTTNTIFNKYYCVNP